MQFFNGNFSLDRNDTINLKEANECSKGMSLGWGLVLK